MAIPKRGCVATDAGHIECNYTQMSCPIAGPNVYMPPGCDATSKPARTGGSNVTCPVPGPNVYMPAGCTRLMLVLMI